MKDSLVRKSTRRKSRRKMRGRKIESEKTMIEIESFRTRYGHRRNVTKKDLKHLHRRNFTTNERVLTKMCHTIQTIKS